MKLYNFDLLAYPHFPKEAPRTPVPSSYFDPPKGAANYAEHIEEMAYCEELGFDGVVFNEHHYSAYGTMPSPNLIAAALSQRTRRSRSACSATFCRCAIIPFASPKSTR